MRGEGQLSHDPNRGAVRGMGRHGTSRQALPTRGLVGGFRQPRAASSSLQDSSHERQAPGPGAAAGEPRTSS